MSGPPAPVLATAAVSDACDWSSAAVGDGGGGSAQEGACATGSSSDGESWLARCNLAGSDEDDSSPNMAANATKFLQLPPDEHFTYSVRSRPGLELTVKCSNAAVRAVPFRRGQCLCYVPASQKQKSRRSTRGTQSAQGIGHQLWPATFLLAAALEERDHAIPGYWQAWRRCCPGIIDT